jgi:hypothetical protein
LARLYLEKTLHKKTKKNRACVVDKGEGPEFKPQYQKRKKKNQN